MNVGSMLGAAAGYVRRHPEELVRVVRNAIARRVGVPLDSLRWLAGAFDGADEVELTAVPPGLKASATIDLMGNRVRASAVVFVESLDLSPRWLRVEARLEDVSLDLLEAAADSPIAMLLQSGVLDLSRPGDLAAHIPRRPAMLVEASGDRVVLDLMKHPRVAATPTVQRFVALVCPILTVSGIETDWEHVDAILELLPAGMSGAVAAVRGAF
jgi:hypothetical protein